MRNTPNILCLRCKEWKESHPEFIFYCKLSKITPDFISEITLDFIIGLINLTYYYEVPFKISLKSIITGTFSQFHDGVQLQMFYTHFYRCFSGIFPNVVGKFFMMIGMTKLTNFFILNVILSLVSISSEILVLNWTQKKPLLKLGAPI